MLSLLFYGNPLSHKQCLWCTKNHYINNAIINVIHTYIHLFDNKGPNVEQFTIGLRVLFPTAYTLCPKKYAP